MRDINDFILEKLNDPEFARAYYRQAAYFQLADQLVLLRKQRGLTQKALADLAGTTQTVVSRLENVSVHASLETVIKLAEALKAAVRIELVPLEELHEEQAARQAAQGASQPAERIVERKIPKIKPLPGTRAAVQWESAPVWEISSRPTLQPIGKKSKTPEFA